MKILIIDDDKNYADTIKDILDEYGYKCICLLDASNAHETSKTFQPNIILCDLKMPMSGFSVAYHLGENDKKIIILGVTSYYHIENEHWLVKLCNFKKIFDKSNTQELIDYLKELQCQMS